MFSRSQTKSLLHFVQWLFYKQTQWICVLVNAKPPISMVKKSELTKICLFPAADKESTGIIFKAMLSVNNGSLETLCKKLICTHIKK